MVLEQHVLVDLNPKINSIAQCPTPNPEEVVEKQPLIFRQAFFRVAGDGAPCGLKSHQVKTTGLQIQRQLQQIGDLHKVRLACDRSDRRSHASRTQALQSAHRLLERAAAF